MRNVKVEWEDPEYTGNLAEIENKKKIIILPLKNEQRTRVDISQRKTDKQPKSIWKILNITNHQVKVNQNHTGLLI